MANLEGQTLGKYQVIERLGRGGMADVYKGYQPGLDRYVAIKVLHSHLSEDTDFIKRFQREAKSVARLSDQGQRMPLAHALDIVAKVADALDYAHREGMVHRDIKPANVLLPTIDKPLLGDFGIARIFGQTGLTAEGAMIGTPAYMSPEQGRGESADERSDIYALGIVLYEMLTNHPPYEADTPYAVILKHMNDPLTSPRDMIPELPQAVERVVLKSLAKNPADRYAHAGEMRDALKDAIAAVADAAQPGVATGPVSARDVAAATQPGMAGSGAVTRQAGAVPVQDEGFTQPLAGPQAARRGLPGWLWAVVGVIALAVVIGGLLVSGVLGGGGAVEAPLATETEVEQPEIGR